MPPFIALSSDAETTADRAETIGDVLWDDLNFEREFAFIPRDVYATIPAAKSFDDVPFDRWRELNADGVIVGTVQKLGNGFQVQVRLFDVRRQRQVVRQASTADRRERARSTRTRSPTRSTCSSAPCAASPARKLAFDSDRDGERMSRHGREPRREGDLHLPTTTAKTSAA